MWLRQSTVAVINFGPMLDKTDGVTLETAAGIITSLDHATTGILLSKNGGTLTIREQGGNFVATTYDAHGFFKVSLSVVDTGTLGRLKVVHTEPATYLAVWHDFMVVPANVWDSLFGADKLDVAVVEQANIDFGALQKASITAAVPTAAAIGTDAAGKVLVTPAQKLVTDASGYVTYANAAPPAASAIRTEIDSNSTQLAAIKAKTDSLTFTVAGQADANIQYVNDVALTGNGSTTPWGP